MRTTRLALTALAAALALAGCTSVRGEAPAPPPALGGSPGGSRPPVAAPTAPPAPAAAREEPA
ncbi:hypothetical protein AB0F34_29240, partial [Streptomyces fradiae]